MTNQELDILFAESAKRQKAVDHINAAVMRTVRRDLRLKALRKWARLIGLCFGLPVLTVLYIYALYVYTPAMDMPLRIVAYVLPLGTLAVVFGKQFHDFSPADL